MTPFPAISFSLLNRYFNTNILIAIQPMYNKSAPAKALTRCMSNHASADSIAGTINPSARPSHTESFICLTTILIRFRPQQVARKVFYEGPRWYRRRNSSYLTRVSRDGP